MLQRSSQNTAPVSEVPPIVLEVLNSPGVPLDDTTRGYFADRLGRDFSGVKLHTDARAAQSARAVSAYAYTVGNHIVVGDLVGSGAQQTQVMAHELTHIAQQQGAPLNTDLRMGPAAGRDEDEANRVAANWPRGSCIPSDADSWVGSAVHSDSRKSLQRLAFGKDGELGADLKAIVTSAAEIVGRRVQTPDFAKQWEAFWLRFGSKVSPQPTLAQYRDAVRTRIVHDMDTSKDPEIVAFLKGERELPVERQTAAVTKVGSQSTFMRQFAIRQGVDSVASLLLHESWHGAGIGMGPLLSYELAFHDFETAVGYPIVMGGGRIERITQKRRGKTDVDISITYSLHKIGKDPLPSTVKLKIAQGDSAVVVHERSIPARAGRNTVVWRASNPGWNSYSVRIVNVDEGGSIMATERVETNPACVLGVSSMHCEDD